jgi:kynurenine formamidase
MHGTDGMGDMASYPLNFVVGPGAVVDVSQHMDDWAVITPAMLEAAPVEIKNGDILIIHT